MTNRERADKWLAAYRYDVDFVDGIAALLDEVAAEARAEEREACIAECHAIARGLPLHKAATAFMCVNALGDRK